MDVLKCVECPLKQWDCERQALICTGAVPTIDLSDLLLVSPQILNTVKCQQDLNAVVRECYRRIGQLNKTVELAMNLKTEREGTK